jgi:hypothetical protein
MLQDVVWMEHLRNDFSLEDEKETYLHRLAFELLTGAALDPADSKAFIVQTLETCWSRTRP